jgi:multiple sugar transport system permease protein
MSSRRKNKIRKILLIVLGVFLCLYTFVPLFWAFRISVISKEELLKSPPDWLPEDLTADNYSRLLGLSGDNILVSRNFFDAFVNSLITCVAATVVICLIAILAGYVFARWEFRGRNLLFGVLLITMVLPAYSVMLPLYRIMASLRLIDTILCVVLIYVSAFMPLAIWIMRSFFLSVPQEIEEAAWLDGASRWRGLKLILPLTAPGLVAAAIITFLSTWSQYVIPLVFAASNARPLTVFLTTLIGKTSIDYGVMAAGGLVSILPPLVLILVFNRFLVQGLTKGAIK